MKKNIPYGYDVVARRVVFMVRLQFRGAEFQGAQ